MDRHAGRHHGHRAPVLHGCRRRASQHPHHRYRTERSRQRISRAVDPDPDNNSTGSATTANQRGIDANSDGDFLDAGDVSPSDFVGSIGLISGRPRPVLRLHLNHNTGIVFSCCSVTDPDVSAAAIPPPPRTTMASVSPSSSAISQTASRPCSTTPTMGGSLATIDIPVDPVDRAPCRNPACWRCSASACSASPARVVAAERSGRETKRDLRSAPLSPGAGTPPAAATCRHRGLFFDQPACRDAGIGQQLGRGLNRIDRQPGSREGELGFARRPPTQVLEPSWAPRRMS